MHKWIELDTTTHTDLALKKRLRGVLRIEEGKQNQKKKRIKNKNKTYEEKQDRNKNKKKEEKEMGINAMQQNEMKRNNGTPNAD